MFKKILSIVVIVLLFTLSTLIFWERFSPRTFYQMTEKYSVINQTTIATSSEPVLGNSGQIIIGGNTWTVEIAKTEADRTTGLSNRKTLYSKKGMLFVFDKMAKQFFWMKDMLIPLDIIFFDDKWQIVEIDNNLQSNSFPKIFGQEVNSQYVLEINAGEAISYDLNVGNQAIFLNK